MSTSLPSAVSRSATALETITLESGGARAMVAPGRGGMVTRFFVGEREVLYLDEATLLDPKQNVRGGNPVLFPSPGPLVGDRFERGGRAGNMKQHGFARQKAWNVTASDGGSATLTLASDEATRAVFPWDFSLEFRYSLDGPRLTIEQRVENSSDDPMPFALGFHPYFRVPDAAKGRASIPTRARRAFDNVTKSEVAVDGPVDLTQAEVDLHLIDHGASEATLHLAGEGRVVVSASPEYKRWVIWTLRGKDFVCLEPWTAGANALNSGTDLLTVPPRERVTLSTTIAWCA